MAKLEYYEYMTIPLAYFPPWIVDQYDLNLHITNPFKDSSNLKTPNFNFVKLITVDLT